MLTTALKMPHICIYTLCMQICAQADYYTLKWHIDLLALKGSCFPNVWNAINIRKNSLWGSLLVFSRLSCCAAATCPTGFCTQSPHVVTGEWEPSREWRWTGSGGRSPTPGTKAHRRGRTQPGTACCSGWPQSPASGTQTAWVTNRNTRWTVTGDCWGPWTEQSLPEQLVADFQFCVQVTVLSLIPTILSIFYLLEQQRVCTSQSNLCTAHCCEQEMLLQKKKIQLFSSVFHKGILPSYHATQTPAVKDVIVSCCHGSRGCHQKSCYLPMTSSGQVLLNKSMQIRG